MTSCKFSSLLARVLGGGGECSAKNKSDCQCFLFNVERNSPLQKCEGTGASFLY